jgi:putative peptidoglycan lipid II flippase
MGPGTLGLAATQVNLFVNTLLATTQGTGAVSWLTYAFRIMYLPIGLFGVSIATALLPAVSRHAATDDIEGIRRSVSGGIGLMLMLNIPATLGLIVLATPIVQLLFERGRFVAADTAATAAALRLYAVGLVGYSTARIASPTFYALGQSRVPVIVSACTIAVNIACSVALVRAIGVGGLALGTSCAALANGGVLLLILRQRLSGIRGHALWITFVKVMAASIVMAGVSLGAERGASYLIVGGHTVLQAMRLAIAIGTGLAALALSARLLAIEEFDDALALVRMRIGGHRDRRR